MTAVILAITIFLAIFEDRVRAARRATLLSRERLVDAIESMSDAFALFDADQRLVLYNSNYDRMVGRRPDELSIGSSFEEIIGKRADRVLGDVSPEETAEWVRERLELLARADGTPLERQLANGQWHRITHRRTSEGGTVVIRSDITDAKLREKELIEARKFEAVGRLAGGTAHEFNNLLMAILGSLHLMRQRIKGDERLLTILERAWVSSRRAADLINGMVSFAQKQFLKTEKVDLIAAVERAVSKTPLDLRKDIRLNKEFASDLCDVLVDPGQLETALINVLLNAIEAIPGNGTITIAAHNLERDGDKLGYPLDPSRGRYVALTVMDTGIGMDPETLEMAPEPFFTTKEIGQGTGLGLSIVHGFARQSGGHFGLESSKGKGTTVTLVLPVHEVALPEQKQKIA
jgi:PAS domain S-box-containing protein